jgi:hypothetical protein
MKNMALIILTLLCTIISVFSQEKFKEKINSPVLNVPYFGQKLPGMAPEIFAPSIISTEVLNNLNGTYWLVEMLLYNPGLRLTECLEL